MKAVSLAQKSTEWAEWRKSGVGASESGSIAAAIGLLPQPAGWMDTIQELWEYKVNLRPAKKMHPGMARGVEYEDDAVADYQQKTKILTSPVCGSMDGIDHILASFDGIDIDGKIILETKIPNEEVINLASSGIVIPYYEPQCAHQCLVAWGHPDQWPHDGEHHFFAYQPETNTGHLVVRNGSYYKQLAESLMPAIDGFWNSVLTRTPPCGDKFLQAAIRYRIVAAGLAEAKALEEIAKKELVDLLQPNVKKASGGGVTVTKFPKDGSISYADFAKSVKATPEQLEAFRGESTTAVRVTIEKKTVMPELSEAVQIAIGAKTSDPCESSAWAF